MRKIAFIFLLFLLIGLVGCIHSAGIVKKETDSLVHQREKNAKSEVVMPSQSEGPKPDWIDRETESDGKFHYFIGISGNCMLERDARNDAFRDAANNLARYIGIDTSIDWISLKVSGQSSSQIIDFNVYMQEEVSQIVRACFSRFKANDWYTQRYGQNWKIYVRAKIPVEEVDLAIKRMDEIWKKIDKERRSRGQLQVLLPAFNKIASLSNKGTPLVKVTTDKKNYAPGEIIKLKVHLEQDAYLTIFNYDTSGNIKVLLPNYFKKDNFYRQGIYPFELKAEEAGGIERLKIFATLNKKRFFDLNRLTEKEQVFIIRRGDLASAEALVKSTVTEINTLVLDKWSEDTCQFSINAPEIVLAETADEEPKTDRDKPTEIKIEEVSLENIFPSRCGYYRFNPIGWIKINNSSDIPVPQVKVSLMIPGYMTIPYQKEVYIKAQSSSKIPLFATFDQEKIFGVNENTPVQAQVKVVCRKEDVFSETPLITVFNKNAMDWKKPVSIGGFITPNDLQIKKWVNEMLICLKEDEDFKPKELLQPIAIFEAIMALLPKYVADTRISRSFPGVVLDMIQYPRETLNLPTGDCDDWTVLYATCLLSIGRRVVLITIPEHIFLAFDTGIHLKNRALFSLVEGTYMEIDDHAWIPMELTKTDSSFWDAWRAGVEEYNQLKDSPELKVINLEEACKIYPAVEVAPLSSRPYPQVSQMKEAIISRVKKTTDAIKMNSDKAYKELISKYTNQGDYSKLGYLYAMSGKYTQAIEEFNKAKNWNNLGNVYLLQNNYEKAKEVYSQARTENPNNGGVCLNQAICSLLQGREEEAGRYFTQAIEIYPDYRQVCFDIGLDWSVEKSNLKSAGIATLLLKIKTLLEETKEKLAKLLTSEKVEEKKLEGHIGVREERGIAWEKMSQEELIMRVCYWKL